MKAVLLSGGPHFPGPVVVDGVTALVKAGYDVTYVSWSGPSQALVDAVSSVVVLGRVPAGGEGQRAPVPPRSQLQRRVRQARTVLRRQPSRMWSAVRRRRDVRDAVDSADLLVAVDSQAILACWRLAREHPQVEAVYGIAAALITAPRP